MELVPGNLYKIVMDKVYLYKEDYYMKNKTISNTDHYELKENDIVMFIKRVNETNIFLYKNQLYEGMKGLCNRPERYLEEIQE